MVLKDAVGTLTLDLSGSLSAQAILGLLSNYGQPTHLFRLLSSLGFSEIRDSRGEFIDLDNASVDSAGRIVPSESLK